RVPEGMFEEVFEQLKRVEDMAGRKLGDLSKPLLVSVRSGAKFSMPGMMDTVLNLGLNDETVQALSKLTNNERFAWDSYRRFIQMYGNVVLGIPKDEFEDLLDHKKKSLGVSSDTELDSTQIQALVNEFKALVKKESHHDFPQDPTEQLKGSIEAVFRS